MDEGSDSRFTNMLKRMFGTTEQHLEEHILDARAEGEIESEEVSMLLNILDFNDKKVSEIMVPRTDMVCAEAKSSVKDIVDIVINHGAHSRIPIFEGTKDHIIGVVHSKDLLHPLLQGNAHAPISELVRPTMFVSEEMRLDKVLASLKIQKLHMTIIQDEYGGTAGMVTMEDLLEEIVGDISDEYDAIRPEEIREIEKDIFIISGRATLEEVSEKCALELESENVDSIGGYLGAMTGRIPKTGEFFTFEGHKFTVLEADDRQVWSIRLEPLMQGL